MVKKEDSMNKKIYFAGGCFWGVEAYFDMLKGVVNVNSGYANGTKENPTYQEVCNGTYGFVETVSITYNEDIKLTKLLEHFFRFVDPYAINKQGNDKGIQYRSGIYYDNLEDEKIIKKYINELQEKTNKKIVVQVLPIENYYLAEKYHQKYLHKNPQGYCHVNLNLVKDYEKKSNI